jgi:hypothetical protein
MNEVDDGYETLTQYNQVLVDILTIGHKCSNTHAHTQTRNTHTHTHKYASTHTHTHTRKHTHTHVHTHTHTHMYTRTHTHTHTHTNICKCVHGAFPQDLFPAFSGRNTIFPCLRVGVGTQVSIFNAIPESSEPPFSPLSNPV